MRAFWQILKRYVAPYKGYLAGSVFFNVLSAVFNVFSFSLLIPVLQILFNAGKVRYELLPWHRGMSLNEVTNNVYFHVSRLIDQFGQGRVLLGLCLLFIVITLIKVSCYFGASAVMVPIRTGVVRDLRMEIYRKILSLPLGFFSRGRKGDIIARISGDVQEVETSISGTLEMLIKNPILILIYLGVLFRMSWQLTLFVIVFAPLMIGVISAAGRRLKADSKEAQRYWSDTMSQVEETLGGLRVVKAFRAERRMERRFEQVTESMRRKSSRVAIRQASAHPVSEFLGSAMIAIILWFGGILILGERSVIDAPAFMSYMALLYSVIQPIKDLSSAAYGIPKGLASMERIDAILRAENPIRESAAPRPLDGLRDAIRFEGVRFRFDDGHEVLHGIDLEIPKGKTVAIVGASGAGKSTLVDLIPRFYDPSAGAITLDGTDIRDVSLHNLRALIGYVNQEPILFNDTLFNNIAFGKQDATPEEVERAARIAGAHEFILEKENGYETNIGDRGVKLSGGQRQRISIARAILKNPPILILDEATASLDTESERSVQEALEKLMSGRTTIAIAHRLSTIRHADEIIVLDGGRIVERGRHDELIARNGHYRKLHDLQAL